MPCDHYDDYVGDGSHEHFDQLKVEALDAIGEVFGIEPIFGIPDGGIFSKVNRVFNDQNPCIIINPEGRRTPFFFESNNRIYEFNDLTWRYQPNQGLFKHLRFVGLYTYDTGTIFLRKLYWCRKTFIHEILHATSLFSRIELETRTRNFIRIQDPLIESLTETLTGYVLKKKFPFCYRAWIEERYRECSIAGYKPRVRLWCSVCQHIGIKKVATFYLSELDSFNEAWNQLQQSIRDMGFTSFNYPLDERTPYNEMEFREIAFRSISGLRDTYEDLRRNLDFSRILL